MAVISKATPPPKPSDLDLKLLSDNSLEIRWGSADGGCNDSYELEIRYFQFGGPMIHADHSTVMEVKGFAAHVLHPENLCKDSPWVVKIGVRTKSHELLSDPVVKQICWDEEMSTKGTQKDLEKRIDDLQKKELQTFFDARQIWPSFLLLNLTDQMDVASAGNEEKTLATKSLAVPLNTSEMSFIDTPAFANMSKETADKLQTLLSTGIQDGARRDKLSPDERSYFSKPPHGAIVVMSLCHWRDQTDEMQSYLEKMAQTFKEASGGQVAFPYVVACTHRDVFLKDCQKEDPAKELQKAVDGIKKAALTDHVYSITSYKMEGVGSVRNNKATFDLLCQLLTKAKNENTAKVQEKNQKMAINGIFLVAALMGLFAVAANSK